MRSKRHYIFQMIFLGCWILFAFLIFPLMSNPLGGDFFAMLSHRALPSAWWDGQGYGYGPIFALYDLALQPLNDHQLVITMHIWNTILLCGALFFALKLFFRDNLQKEKWLFLAAIWFFFYPIVQAARQNNVEVTELFFITIALYSFYGKNDLISGVMWGLAAAVKIIPILIVPYLIWRRRFKMIFGCLAAFGVMLLTVACMKGFQVLEGFSFLKWASAADHLGAYGGNQTIFGLVSRFFADWNLDADNLNIAMSPHVLNHFVATILGYSLSVFVVLMTAYIYISRVGIICAQNSRDLELTEQLLVLTVLLMCLHASHTHYYALIAPAYLLLFRELRNAALMWRFFGVLSYLLFSVTPFLRVFDVLGIIKYPVGAVALWQLWSMPFIGAVFLAITLFHIHRVQLELKGDDYVN